MLTPRPGSAHLDFPRPDKNSQPGTEAAPWPDRASDANDQQESTPAQLILGE
jgi:hypothetical protein